MFGKHFWKKAIIEITFWAHDDKSRKRRKMNCNCEDKLRKKRKQNCEIKKKKNCRDENAIRKTWNDILR